MGYLRTAISLVGFGFSISTFFHVLQNVPGFEDISATRPRILGLFLLILAVVMLVTSVVQQTMYLRQLSKTTGTRFSFSIATAASIVVLAIALFAIFNIFLRIGLT